MRLTEIIIGLTEIELCLMVILAKLKISGLLVSVSDKDRKNIQSLGYQYETLRTMWCYHRCDPTRHVKTADQIVRCVDMNVSALPNGLKSVFVNGQYTASLKVNL